MIEEQIQIKAPIANVFETFAKLECWPDVLPDTLGVEVLYDDGKHQEFKMTVSRPNGPETIRGVRFLVPLRTIELFQPVPPPGFRKMCGVWNFDQDGGGTTVRVTREIEPEDPGSYNAIAEKLRTILRTNLGLFQEYIERRAAHSN